VLRKKAGLRAARRRVLRTARHLTCPVSLSSRQQLTAVPPREALSGLATVVFGVLCLALHGLITKSGLTVKNAYKI